MPPTQASDIWVKDEGDFAFVGWYTERGLAWLQQAQPTAHWHDDQRIVITASAQETIVRMADRAGLRVQWS